MLQCASCIHILQGQIFFFYSETKLMWHKYPLVLICDVPLSTRMQNRTLDHHPLKVCKLVDSFLGKEQLSRDFSQHISKLYRILKLMEEEQKQHKPHLCSMNLVTFWKRKGSSIRILVIKKSLSPKHWIFTMTDGQGFSSALFGDFLQPNFVLSKTTFLETFLEMLQKRSGAFFAWRRQKTHWN